MVRSQRCDREVSLCVLEKRVCPHQKGLGSPNPYGRLFLRLHGSAQFPGLHEAAHSTTLREPFLNYRLKTIIAVQTSGQRATARPSGAGAPLRHAFACLRSIDAPTANLESQGSRGIALPGNLPGERPKFKHVSL